MILSEKDAVLYYRLWFPLLDYVNRTYHVNRKLPRIAKNMPLNPEEVKKVADYLWSHPDIIDLYLAEHSDLEDDHRGIIAGWKYPVTGTFMVERHLKKGSILIGEDDKVYLVKGIISDWEELTMYSNLTAMVTATLIPWRNVIIPDGLISMMPVTFGPNITGNLKETYLKAKKEKKIITSLPE